MEKKERNHNSYCELPEGEEVTASSPAPSPAKRESRKDIRILRKCKSIKERSDPERFNGEGVSFRAKIIGTENVVDARGNRMCQGALQRLKAAVKSSGDHKQKIILNISLDGIIIKDEKSGDLLHQHPIHKISFISQDTKDNRAFGYVYGCPQTGHQFFAIKTEKTASQVVVTLRDLFLVALEMKKSEIEQNNLEQAPEEMGRMKPATIPNTHKNDVSNGSVAPPLENSSPNLATKQVLLYSNTVFLPEESREPDSLGAILNLQLEVDSLQQGISQIDHSIATTFSQNLGVSFSEDDVSEASLTSIPNAFHFKLDKLTSLYQETMSISSRSSSTSDYNVGAVEGKVEENETPKKELLSNVAVAPPEACSSGISSLSIESNSTMSEEANESVVEDRYAVFLDIDSIPSIFDDPSFVKMPQENINLPTMSRNFSGEKNELSTNYSEESELEVPEIKSSTPVAFAELDPLGNQPYVDKRDFFQNIKNPPKRVLKDLPGVNSDFFPDNQTGSQESLAFDDTKLRTQENVVTLKEISSSVTIPPKLPPKRCATSVSSELQQNSKDPVIWEPRNPFNPFVYEEYPDIPPPNSAPPPPPPRIPVKVSESSPTLSSPPPRPPSRISDVPTPPLPKRKVPLSSANRTWFSFDQDIAVFPPTPFTPEIVDPGVNHAPPLPSPARKLPPPKLTESPLLKSSSASNSPATLRRLYNKSPCSAITSEIKDPKLSILTNSPKKALSSILQENYVSCNAVSEVKNPQITNSPKKVLSQHSSIVEEKDAFSSPIFNPFFQPRETLIKETVESSPPLPPKPVSISQSRHSPLKRGIPVSSCSSSGVSVIESSGGTVHSSSSLVFSSLEENKLGSSSEALFINSTGNNSDVFSHSSEEMESSVVKDAITSNIFSKISGETTQPQSSNGSTEEHSPDSIFHRKSDPFADDFFLSLHKKSNFESPIIAKGSNGVEEHFDNLKAPT